MKLVCPLVILLLSTSMFSSCTKETVDIASPVQPPPVITQPNSSPRTLLDAQLVTLGSMSQSRSNPSIVSEGNKIVIAGGELSQGMYSSRVDIYDISTNSWATSELSQARSNIAVVVLDKNIYFAGGRNGTSSYSSRIDIYNTVSNTWSTTDIGMVEALLSGASAGNKVVFASGVTAHIFDASTNSWSTAPLSQRPGEGNCCQGRVDGIAATVINDQIYFAGGIGSDLHKAIDIYNASTNTWSTSSLIEPKGGVAGIAVNGANFWAGGLTFGEGYRPSRQVEIRNMTSGFTMIEELFQPNAFFSAVQKNNRIVFFTGSGVEKNKFDIFDTSTNTWLIGKLTENVEGAAIISVNNTIYVAGGKINGALSDKFRKLDF